MVSKMIGEKLAAPCFGERFALRFMRDGRPAEQVRLLANQLGNGDIARRADAIAGHRSTPLARLRFIGRAAPCE